MRRFVCDYLGLLKSRLRAIAERLAAGDREGAIVALLSLETTSEMLGGDAVVAAAAGLREKLAEVGPVKVGRSFAALTRATDDLRRRLVVISGLPPDDEPEADEPAAEAEPDD